MVGVTQKTYNLDEVLTEKQVDVIVRKALGNGFKWKLIRSELRPASEGIAGFLGDHMKGALHLESDGEMIAVYIFIKRMPANNKPKADFINEHNFFRRERLMFSLIEEFDGIDSNPWAPKAYIHTDEILVLPDLSVQGYGSRHFLETLDMPHVLLTVAAIARFHASYANYATKKSANGVQYSILDEYGKIMAEPTFKESLWMRSAAKLTANFLKTFSIKYNNIPGLENNLYALYLVACDSFRDYDDTLNVIVHKDLWTNNIMFKYDNGVPVNSLLVDFQCLRYGPPAFDIMLFLYLTTSRSFREKNEREVFLHYYKIFCQSLDDDTKERISLLGYDKENFLNWCEKGRMFGMLEAITIYPYTLLDPRTAEKIFDDPETYDKYLNEDRSEPVIAHAKKCQGYKDRQLEICEEFIEIYLLKEKRRSGSKNCFKRF